MNIKFNKALFLLDQGRYNEGEECLLQAFKESRNKQEMIQIRSCYLELLYKQKRFDEAKECIDFILENTAIDENSKERKVAVKLNELIVGDK